MTTKFTAAAAVQNENKMDCDEEHEEDSTSLSEESNLSNLSDPRFEADDEQSDYYEVSSNLQKKNRQRHFGRTSLEKSSSFGIVNPFAMSASPSTSIWKRRRRNPNLPNNHFN